MVNVIVVSVLLSDRTEVSIATSVSLLRLQNALAKSDVGGDIELRITFASDFNEALNSVPLDARVVCVDARAAFDPEFVLGLLDPACPPVVVGVHPLPRVDWDRVTERVRRESKEPLEHSGNVYNVAPKISGEARADGRWVPIDTTNALVYCVGVLPAALATMHAAAEVTHNPAGPFRIFSRDGVIDGVFVDKHTWLLHLVDPGDVFCDTAAPCSFTGIAEFAGCVGQRSTLR